MTLATFSSCCLTCNGTTRGGLSSMRQTRRVASRICSGRIRSSASWQQTCTRYSSTTTPTRRTGSSCLSACLRGSTGTGTLSHWDSASPSRRAPPIMSGHTVAFKTPLASTLRSYLLMPTLVHPPLWEPCGPTPGTHGACGTSTRMSRRTWRLSYQRTSLLSYANSGFVNVSSANSSLRMPTAT